MQARYATLRNQIGANDPQIAISMQLIRETEMRVKRSLRSVERTSELVHRSLAKIEHCTRDLLPISDPS
jgi:hypothetical protein